PAAKGQAGSRSVQGLAKFCGNDAQRLFDLFALGDIHIDSREAQELALGVACGAAQAMHPNHCSIGPDGPELDIPNVITWSVPDLLKRGRNRGRSSGWMHATQVSCLGVSPEIPYMLP